MGKYDDLKALEELRERGAISEEEYQNEKNKILNSSGKKDLWGIEESQFLMFMHLSLFAGYLIPLAGYALPIAMWLSFKDENANVNLHGKNILNFIISWAIYCSVAGILTIILIGLPILIALGITNVVFIILAAIKASAKEYWEYPLSIRFLN